MNLARLTLLAVAVLFASSCASLRAATSRTGGPIAIDVVFEAAPGQNNAEQIAQVIAFAQPDMVELLNRAGYVATPISDANAFQPGPDHYLLQVVITNYNPGSKAARMLVGFGAGTLVLDTRNTLSTVPGQVVFSSTSSVASSIDWDRAARKINVQVAREMTARLNEL